MNGVYSLPTAPAIAELRKKLRRAGFSPLPVDSEKHPATKGWQHLDNASDAEIDLWAKRFPLAENTGVLTRFAPALDIDILDPEAAEAVEALARERFEEQGPFLVRFGQIPKRAVLFRTDQPFSKIGVDLIAPNGKEGEKIELLCNGQQLVVAGLHLKAQRLYSWHGGQPGDIKREDLPYLHEEEAHALIADSVALLVRDFGYTQKRPFRPKPPRNPGEDAPPPDWPGDPANHDDMVAMAMKLIKGGLGPGAAVNHLRGLVEGLANIDPERKARRLKEIPAMVESAQAKLEAETPPQPPPTKLDEVAALFKKWLVLTDLTPVYAVLGGVAANLLEGDPVWLGVIAPSSTAKTEILKALFRVPKVRPVGKLSEPGLLSGTPKKQSRPGAKGGLLREIGDRGILVMKDFGLILAMRREARSEVIGALRDIYDGEYSRNVGSDGGRTLTWRGKIGFMFAATQSYDDYYSVISQLGDRFLICRLKPAPGHDQFERAFDHAGEKTQAMRDELAGAVAGLYANVKEPSPLDAAERAAVERVVKKAVRLRTHVERDAYSRDIESGHDPEGPGRLSLMLERLFAGLAVIGLERKTALGVVETVALDSCPRMRRRVFELLSAAPLTTRAVADELRLPAVTARRRLEDLLAVGLAVRARRGDDKDKEGGADEWTLRSDWEKVWETRTT
jgi:Bifunctional DNA primase/polymerase, N-terminal